MAGFMAFGADWWHCLLEREQPQGAGGCLVPLLPGSELTGGNR